MAVRRIAANVVVDGLAAALDLYTSTLGLVEVMNHGWVATVADPADPARHFNLLVQDATGPCNSVVSVEVDDPDEAYAAVVAGGAEIVYPPSDETWGVRRFFFRDPSGNVVNVLAHR